MTLPNHHLQSAMPLSVPIVPSGTSVPFATCFHYEITYSSLLHIYLTCLYFFFYYSRRFLETKVNSDRFPHSSRAEADFSRAVALVFAQE